MAKRFLATKYNKHPHVVNTDPDTGEMFSEFTQVNNGPKLVDPAFVPMKYQIQAAIAAGENLHDFKVAQYHALHPEDIPEGYYDPMTTPNYDPSDATQDLSRIAARAVAGRKKMLQEQAEPKPPVPETVPESTPEPPPPVE